MGDLSPEGPLPPLLLLQQLLSAATQPSPIKALFQRQELEVTTSTEHLLTQPKRVPFWCTCKIVS